MPKRKRSNINNLSIAAEKLITGDDSASASAKKKKKMMMMTMTALSQKPKGNDSKHTEKTSSNDEEPWSKSKKKRMRRLMARQNRSKNDTTDTISHNESPNNLQGTNIGKSNTIKHNGKRKETNATKNNMQSSSQEEDVLNLQSTGTKRKLSSLQQKFLSRLSGSRFRELNEELYTTTSSSAFKRFQEHPELFDQYHQGFRTQVKSWPVNPVDIIYKWIISYYQRHREDFQKKNQSQLRVADFGCGDAKLAEKLLNFQSKGASHNAKKERNSHGDESISKHPFKVHSFDLVANGNKLITPCDMSNVPLKNSSVDIGVFVLALMGTNIADFIREAHRVLTPGGILKIAEVRSRFEATACDDEASNYKKQTDESLLDEFLDVMTELGFKCVKKDRQNKMFIILEFEKTGTAPSKKASFTAKPCVYKRR